MKVRVLTDTIPAWLAVALLEYHEPELVVGAAARREHAAELWPVETAPRARRGGHQPGHLAGGKTHGREATYGTGCRCADCTEARRAGNERRRRLAREAARIMDTEPDDYTGDWQLHAACRGVDPDLFFPTRGEEARHPKRICAGCPVRRPCLEYALAADEKVGVWGGLSARERRLLRRRRAVDPSYQPELTIGPDCGTTAGYRRHRTVGEIPCDACRQAATDYRREWGQNRDAG